ncbi:MAG: dienelactone hydrolase family protein [Gemmatimonadota bacterium]|nr:dienelactone hydrolase family protein [Gemmatimonadota bacterium]
MPAQPLVERTVRVIVASLSLDATLAIPERAQGIVLFAHGSGSSRHSPRNRAVAAELQRASMSTLLLDLLTNREEHADPHGGQPRFDIELLTDRLLATTSWVRQQAEIATLPIGYFGASTGAAAALVAAARQPGDVGAIVSRGGRPDLAGDALADVRAPTLLIVGSDDREVLELNERARARMHGEVRLDIIDGATHLFEEPGALEEVARLATAWFIRHLTPGSRATAP